MANNDNNNQFNDIDDDLLAQIQRWTEKAQQEKAGRRNAWQPEGTSPPPPRAPEQNPWAAELTAAADRALWDNPQDGLPGMWEPPAQPARPVYQQPAAYQPPASQPPAGERKKKMRHPVRRFLATVLFLAVLLGAGGYALVFNFSGKMDRRLISDEDRAILFEPTGTTRVTNILLLGMDTEKGNELADTMLLLSVDRVNRKLKLTSFLRDSWVKMPGTNGKYNKLNTAVSLGGPAMAMRAVSENFNVRVDHYVLVNFAVFEQVVDALGGVSVPITDEEADFLCRTAGPFKQMGREKIREQMEKSGAVKLNGLEALVFCRIRKLDDDFHRTERQRKFMNSMVQACKKNPFRLFGLLGDALSNVQTDMSQMEVANLAATAPLLLGYEIEEFTVPAQGTWSYATKNGASVITLETDKNAEKLWEFIYEE